MGSLGLPSTRASRGDMLAAFSARVIILGVAMGAMTTRGAVQPKWVSISRMATSLRLFRSDVELVRAAQPSCACTVRLQASRTFDAN